MGPYGSAGPSVYPGPRRPPTVPSQRSGPLRDRRPPAPLPDARPEEPLSGTVRPAAGREARAGPRPRQKRRTREIPPVCPFGDSGGGPGTVRRGAEPAWARVALR